MALYMLKKFVILLSPFSLFASLLCASGEENAINEVFEARRGLISLYYEANISAFKFSQFLTSSDADGYIKNVARDTTNKPLHKGRNHESIDSIDTSGLTYKYLTEEYLVALSDEDEQANTFIDGLLQNVNQDFKLDKNSKQLTDKANILRAGSFSFANNLQFADNASLYITKALSVNNVAQGEEDYYAHGNTIYFDYQDSEINIVNQQSASAFKEEHEKIDLGLFYIGFLSYFDVNNICYDFSLVKQTKTTYFFDAKLNSSRCNFSHLYKSVAVIVSKTNNTILKTIYYDNFATPKISVKYLDFEIANDSVYVASKIELTDFSRNMKAYITVSNINFLYNINQNNLHIKKEDLDTLSIKSLY